MRELRAELFNADRRIYMTKLRVGFSQFCEPRRKVIEIRNFTFDEAIYCMIIVTKTNVNCLTFP
jgi:hypothetical protein